MSTYHLLDKNRKQIGPIYKTPEDAEQDAIRRLSNNRVIDSIIIAEYREIKTVSLQIVIDEIDK